MNLTRFHGVVPAMATPFAADESFDAGPARRPITPLSEARRRDLARVVEAIAAHDR